MTQPRPQDCVALCLGCMDWQVQAAPRAVSEHGGAIELYRALADVVDEHWRTDHPDAGPLEGMTLPDGSAAKGGVLMTPLPSWWVDR